MWWKTKPQVTEQMVSLLLSIKQRIRIMMNAFRRIFLLVTIAVFGGISALHAQKVGSTSMQFLKVMPSARATALGEAYSVWASGAEAVFWNPAGLADLENIELSTTYINWLFDSQQGAVSFACSMGDIGALAVQLQYVDFGEFEETTNARPFIKNVQNPGLTGRTFNPFSYLVGVSYARYLTDKFSLGLSVKFAHESLFNGESVVAQIRQGVYEKVDTWANGLLFDFGIRYYTGFKSVYLGSSVQNFGADVKYAKESNPVPLLFRVGIGADIIGPKGLWISGSDENRLSMATDIFHPNDYAQQVHMGVEYEYSAIFALRGGYKFNYDFDGLTLGAGFRHNTDGFNLSVDYSYGAMGTWLGNVQRLSIGIALP